MHNHLFLVLQSSDMRNVGVQAKMNMDTNPHTRWFSHVSHAIYQASNIHKMSCFTCYFNIIAAGTFPEFQL